MSIEKVEQRVVAAKSDYEVGLKSGLRTQNQVEKIAQVLAVLAEGLAPLQGVDLSEELESLDDSSEKMIDAYWRAVERLQPEGIREPGRLGVLGDRVADHCNSFESSDTRVTPSLEELCQALHHLQEVLPDVLANVDIGWRAATNFGVFIAPANAQAKSLIDEMSTFRVG